MQKPRFTVAIIGAGKVGSVLGKLLIDGGQQVRCIISRTEASARKAARFLHCRDIVTSFQGIPASVNLVLITTPHGAIASVSRALAGLDHLKYNRLAVCHVSGMLTADVLEPLRERGATVFSFHPLQTFPRDFLPGDIVQSARGIYYGVDGTAKGIRVARQLARVLQGRIIEIPPEMREFYHAACVVASNHLTVLVWVLERMFRGLRVREENFFPVFRPIMEATLENIALTSPAKALSGPVARGGVETVTGHFASIKKHAPEIMPYFLRMTAETAMLARVKGSISEGQFASMMELIHSQANEPSHTQEIR